MKLASRWHVALLGSGLIAAGVVARHGVTTQQPASTASPSFPASPLASSPSCGPAALLTVADAHDSEAALRLREVLQHEGTSKSTVTTLYDLARWGRQAGLNLIGLKAEADALARLPLPAVVHVRPYHFLALLAVDDKQVSVVDHGTGARKIPRTRFDRLFDGYILCVCPARGDDMRSIQGETICGAMIAIPGR
ncbi:MAG: hypothetical protein JXA69_00710 [Phycisphaerae bacterium]|nr:hypothetical protein [Phycisphaerae bacterium]